MAETDYSEEPYRDKIGRLLDDAVWVDTDESRKIARTILKYRITPREWENIGHEQEWLCGGCAKLLDPGAIKTDHCHATGKVRGLLCHSCNIALGWVRDNPRTLRRLAHYVQASAYIVPNNDDGGDR